MKTILKATENIGESEKKKLLLTNFEKTYQLYDTIEGKFGLVVI